MTEEEMSKASPALQAAFDAVEQAGQSGWVTVPTDLPADVREQIAQKLKLTPKDVEQLWQTALQQVATDDAA
ncbi:MAG: hypothetical protein Alpg2KO_27050 [Alphaproteobacteria bacterium]